MAKFRFNDRGSWNFSDGTLFRPILAVGRDGFPDFGFGFLSYVNSSTTFILAILKLPVSVNFTGVDDYTSPPVVVWFDTKTQPVGENSVLRLSADGLSLTDEQNVTIWPVHVTKVVSRMVLDHDGNLKLVDGKEFVIWQTFDHPTNTWLPGQGLIIGTRIFSRVPTTNMVRELFYMSVDEDCIRTAVAWRPAQPYGKKLCFTSLGANASFDFGIGFLLQSGNHVTYNALGKEFQYMRLQPNGHLNVFSLVDGYKQELQSDLLRDEVDGECAYPTSCGAYGVCSNKSNCTCPGDSGAISSRYFRPVNATQPDLGCAEITPLSCQDTNLQTFLELKKTTYFRLSPAVSNVNVEQCKTECLKNCSCKAIIFIYQDDPSKGACSFPLPVFSLKNIISDEETLYKFITLIKVQLPRSSGKKNLYVYVLVSSLLVSLFVAFLFGAYYYFLTRGKGKSKVVTKKREGDRSSIHVTTSIKKFSFADLVCATQNFKVSLGKGGFGSVYEGTLASNHGKRIAVKCLNNQGNNDFLAEVETIGSVHHFNLVKLIGYCTEKSKRFLVYEFMCNGSLDKWIFHQDPSQTLDWETRQQIIVGIARGLEYLHVHCNPNIIHFDIKPQNILLDENFNVKIADFGLAKCINRDQSLFSTLAKGTPGYIAPELFRGRNISAKVDVFSFGIVMLEIICGRKSLHLSNDEYLIDIVKTKVEAGQLSDLVDNIDNMQWQKEEAVKTMKIAIWCLQPYSRRPSMSMVVKVLEGLIDVETITDYSFLTMFPEEPAQKVTDYSSSFLEASILSGPR